MKKNNFIIIVLIVSFFSIFHSNSYSQLSGIYIIGTGGDYLSVSEAVIDLNSIGVSSPVTFLIKSGIYDDFFTINSIQGSSNINNVTFRSQTGNSSDVILYSGAPDSVLLRIYGTDNLTFEDLTFTDYLNSPTQRIRILINGNCENIKILDCKFTGGIKDAGILSGGSKTINLLIDRCEFNIKVGIQLTKLNEYSENTRISNNNFNCAYCIDLSYQSSFIIEKNIVTGNAVPDYFISFCIRMDGCSGDIKILKNRLFGVSDPDGHRVDGIRCNTFYGTSALIANNFISVNSGTCITFYDSKFVKIFYNSLRCDLAHSGNITVVTDTNCIIKNNLLIQIANAGHNSLTYWINRSPLISDFNNFYFNGVDMCWTGDNHFIQSFSQFKALTGYDLNSTNKSVQFISEYDLHLTGSSLHDSDLVGIPISEITDDIDGQPRNPYSPSKGADEPDFPLPVEISLFTSNTENNNVTLNWTTSFEHNNSGFDIERKFDNINWEVIYFMQGAGISSIQNNYVYEDRDLNSGKYRYRLNQKDFNGNSQYYDLINEIIIGTPLTYYLSQNYPNPFNPMTIIKYQCSMSNDVSLKVFDVLGNEVSTLVNEKQTAGSYSVTFDGNNFPSGVYFYKLEAGGFTETKRMILLK